MKKVSDPINCAAAELELSVNRAELDFQREYNLSKKPLQIDLLVVEKLGNVKKVKEILNRKKKVKKNGTAANIYLPPVAIIILFLNLPSDRQSLHY